MSVGFDIVLAESVGVAPMSAKVVQRVGEPTSFTVRYPLEAVGTTLRPLEEAALNPDAPLTVIDGEGNPLVRGVILEQRVHVAHGPVESWVDVKGLDASCELQREYQTRAHTGTVGDILVGVLAPLPSSGVPDLDFEHVADENELIQAEDDLAFVRRVAAAWGHVFDMRFGEQEEARVWAPAIDSNSVATLRINVDNPTVDVMDLAWDVNRPTEVFAAQVGLADKEILGLGEEGASAPPAPPAPGTLADVATRRVFAMQWAVGQGSELDARREGHLAASRWFVSIACTTTARRVGATIHAGDTVTVEGMSTRYDGAWLVWEAEHEMNAVGHTMRLQLVRDTFGSALV